MALGNTAFDALLSTTLSNYRKKLTDNVFLATPLLMWLSENKRTRMLSGGNDIVEPLIYAEGEASSYGEWDALTLTPQEGISAASYPWRQLYASIVISGLEEAKNNGEEALINLLEAKIKQAEKTLKTKLDVMLHGDGTGNSGKDFLGLAHLIGDDTDAATVGGITTLATDNAWWRSTIGDATEVGSEGLFEALRAALTSAYNTSADGNDTVDAMFADQDSYELYESGLIPQIRRQDTKSANLGFENLLFKSAPIFLDKQATDDTVTGINSEYLTLVGHKDRWFKQSKFSDGLSAADGGVGTTVDARYAVITTYGNLTCSNRARQFRVENVGVT